MNVDPSRTAVLALHFERDIIEPSGAFGAAFSPMIVANGVLEHTARVLAAAREHGIAVIYARVVFAPGHPGLEPSTALHQAVLATGALVAGTPGTEIVEQVAPEAGDAVVDHEGTSAFVGGELAQILAARGIDTLVLTGAATNVIVEGTARDAVNAGLHAYVLGDCVAAGDLAQHEASLATIGFITDGVVSSADFLQSLDVQVA